MKRRTLVRRLGTAAVATTTFVGSAAADRSTVGLDRRIDVSDVSGTVPLVEVLETDDLAELDDDVDPETTMLNVAEGATDLNVEGDCCDIRPLCCDDCNGPYCQCCVCVNCDAEDPEEEQ